MKLNSNKKDLLIFLGPVALIYIIFLYLPVISSFIIAFGDYDVLTGYKFKGVDNFKRLFTSERVGVIYANTFKFTAIIVVLHVIIGLALALLVHQLKSKWQTAMRAMYYFPCVLTAASVAIAWKYLFDTDTGVINYFIMKFGLSKIQWLTSCGGVFAVILGFSVWKTVGNAFLYFYIGIETIPTELYEAARIDGSGRWQTFKKVTIPMLTPTIFFVTVSLCILAFGIFVEPFFLTQGGPGDSSRTVALYLYEVAFNEFNMGLSSAISLTMFVILGSFAYIQIKVSSRWVNYDR